MRLRIATWNLHHQGCYYPMQNNTVAFLSSLGAGVVVLTEFFPNKKHDAFFEALKEVGYVYRQMSLSVGGKNRTIIISRLPFTLGDIPPPEFQDAAASNFLHIHLNERHMDIIGLRMPCYKSVSAP